MCQGAPCSEWSRKGHRHQKPGPRRGRRPRERTCGATPVRRGQPGGAHAHLQRIGGRGAAPPYFMRSRLSCCGLRPVPRSPSCVRRRSPTSRLCRACGRPLTASRGRHRVRDLVYKTKAQQLWRNRTHNRITPHTHTRARFRNVHKQGKRGEGKAEGTRPRRSQQVIYGDLVSIGCVALPKKKMGRSRCDDHDTETGKERKGEAERHGRAADTRRRASAT